MNNSCLNIAQSIQIQVHRRSRYATQQPGTTCCIHNHTVPLHPIDIINCIEPSTWQRLPLTNSILLSKVQPPYNRRALPHTTHPIHMHACHKFRTACATASWPRPWPINCVKKPRPENSHRRGTSVNMCTACQRPVAHTMVQPGCRGCPETNKI